MKQRMDMLYSKSCAREEEEEKTAPEAEVASWEPFMDVWESEEEWLVVADLPGVRDEELQVEVLENQLTIAGLRHAVSYPGALRASKIERPEGRFSRTFMLPANAVKEEIQAECKRGVLTVRIPKSRCMQASHHKVIVHSE